MRIAEIMSSPAATIGGEEKVAQALGRMQIAGVHHLVVTHGKEILGTVSEEELSEDLPGELVRERLRARPVTATPHTTVREAANLLRGRNLGCLPVVDGKKLLGVVTVSDLLELLGRG